MTSARIVLASASPRRRELLSSIGIEFDVEPAHIAELLEPGETPNHYVSRLSCEKAAEVSARHPDKWIIAADTIVYLENEILEKPQDVRDAETMLAKIAGREHAVYTGMTLQNFQSGFADTTVTTTRVTITAMSPEEIHWYANTGEPLDKAGSYAVQGIGAMFIEAVRGNYTNVVGLPLSVLVRMLRKAGVNPFASAETGQSQ